MRHPARAPSMRMTSPPPAPSRLGRILDITIVRIVVALFATALAGGLTQAFVSSVAQGRFHVAWPDICGALAALAAYASYVRWIERRRVDELAGQGALV